MNILKVQLVSKIFLNYRVEATSFRKARAAEVFLNPRLSHKMFEIFVVIIAETLKRTQCYTYQVVGILHDLHKSFSKTIPKNSN